MTSMFYKNAHGVMMVYDCTNKVIMTNHFRKALKKYKIIGMSKCQKNSKTKGQ
jgi:hypothetical protein